MRNIEDQARDLARESREAYVNVHDILWFADDTQIRMLVSTEEVAPYEDEAIHPFYFRPAPEFGLDAWTAVALIRPEEVGKLRLPKGWPDWAAAKRI